MELTSILEEYVPAYFETGWNQAETFRYFSLGNDGIAKFDNDAEIPQIYEEAEITDGVLDAVEARVIDYTREYISNKLGGQKVPTRKRIMAWRDEEDGVLTLKARADGHIAYWTEKLG